MDIKEGPIRDYGTLDLVVPESGELKPMTIQAIETYFACLENPNALEYYAEVIEGMNCLVWDATMVKRNVALGRMCHYCSPGQTGLPLMSPGS